MNCEYCNKEHIGTYATGRFCSAECARGFSTKQNREEINKKVSKTLKGRPSPLKGIISPLKGRPSPLKGRKIIQNNKVLITFECISCGTQILRGKKGKFCNTQCQRDYAYNEYIKRWKEGLEDGSKGTYRVSDYIRKYLFKKFNNKCTKCGWGEVNKRTGKIPLHIDHIDGDNTNHKEENLDLICPNCHSLTSTFGSLNTGKGREYYREYKRKKAAIIRNGSLSP